MRKAGNGKDMKSNESMTNNASELTEGVGSHERPTTPTLTNSRVQISKGILDFIFVWVNDVVFIVFDFYLALEKTKNSE